MNWRSKLIHPQRSAPRDFMSLAVPTYRGSTVVFPNHDSVREGWREHEHGYSYGIYGTPTAMELGQRIAELEGAEHTFLVPSGQAAIALVYLAYCTPGSHVLLPSTSYGPSKELGAGLLQRLGIEVELYDPLIGSRIGTYFRDSTVLVWCESPGSVTMEIQDVPAIVAAAHTAGKAVALDNTYAAGVLFDAFASGVDVSIQALTKYVGGHSDVLLGSVSVGTLAAYSLIGDTHRALGMSVSPDECSLALRGLQTLGIRLDGMARSALHIAQWFAVQPEVQRVLHPAIPSCEGHHIWKRDFNGAAGIFSVVFRAELTQQQVIRFVDHLRLFKIGWSWGGTTSLVMYYPDLNRPPFEEAHVVRFNIGLEELNDLIDALHKAMQLAFRD